MLSNHSLQALEVLTFLPGCLKKVTKTDWNADLGIVNVIKGGHTFLEWKLKKRKMGIFGDTMYMDWKSDSRKKSVLRIQSGSLPARGK